MKKLLLLCLVALGGVMNASADTWTVAGEESLMGSDWNTNDENNLMTTSGNIYMLKKTVTLSAQTNYRFKIVKNNSFSEAYPSSDYNYWNETAGTFELIFTFDPDTKNVGAYKSVTVAGSTSLMGSDWDITDTNNDMTFANGVFTLIKKGLNLETGVTYYCKAVKDNRWDSGSWPSNNYELTVPATGLYNVTFTFYPKDPNLILTATPVVAVKTNTDGYATFVNANALTITDATAYYATDNNNGSATAVAITNPAANTPMLIKGEPSTTYYFATSETGETVSSNAFKAGNGSTVASGNGPYNYILNGNTFYAANNKIVATGKAYLQLSAKVSAARSILIFPEDEATAINGVALQEETDGAYYNLQGVKVTAPTKGLYIHNGKKYIVK